MSVQAVLRSVFTTSGKSIDATQAPLGSGAIVVDELLPDTASDQSIPSVAFGLDELKAIAMLVEGGAVELYTNDASGGAPQEKITLADGQPFIYVPGQYEIDDAPPAAPFAGDVTGLYATVPGDDAVRLKILVLIDATP